MPLLHVYLELGDEASGNQSNQYQCGHFHIPIAWRTSKATRFYATTPPSVKSYIWVDKSFRNGSYLLRQCFWRIITEFSNKTDLRFLALKGNALPNRVACQLGCQL